MGLGVIWVSCSVSCDKVKVCGKIGLLWSCFLFDWLVWDNLWLLLVFVDVGSFCLVVMLVGVVFNMMWVKVDWLEL